MGFQRFVLLGAHAGDFLEFVGGGEAAVFGAPVEDSLGQDRSYAGERVQLVEGGGVEVERGGGRGRVCAWGCRRWGGCGGDAHEDLFAVGYLAGKVERGQVYAGERTACRGQYVSHAGAGFGPDKAGAADFAGYVYDDCRCGTGGR